MGKLVVRFKYSLLMLLAVLIYASPSKAESFAPTWKLLSLEEKRSFVSGFVQGWRYSQEINNIMLQFVRQHPDRSIEAIEDVDRLYRIKYPKLDILIGRLDEFYSKPENSGASVSKALSSVSMR